MSKPKTIKDLKRIYNQSVKDNIEIFEIDGFEFYTPFAKYLLEYLDMLKIHADTPLKTILKKTDGD